MIPKLAKWCKNTKAAHIIQANKDENIKDKLKYEQCDHSVFINVIVYLHYHF